MISDVVNGQTIEFLCACAIQKLLFFFRWELDSLCLELVDRNCACYGTIKVDAWSLST